MNNLHSIIEAKNLHKDRLDKLTVLLEKVNQAILGEEPQMRFELEKIKKNTIEAIKEETACLKELSALEKDYFVNA